MVDELLVDLFRKRDAACDDLALLAMALTPLDRWRDLEFIEPPADRLVLFADGEPTSITLTLPAVACRVRT